MQTQSLLRTLSSMLIHLNALQTLLEGAATASEASQQELRAGLQTLEQMMRDALSMVRISADDEPLEQLEGVTLNDALSRIVEETAEQLGLSSHITFTGATDQEHSLSRAIERLLFLFVREALYQVQFHSGARRLRLTLNYGRDDVQLSIENDGLYTLPEAAGQYAYHIPAPPLALQTGPATALASPVIADLRARFVQVGGVLEISLTAERGTNFLARVPYVPPAEQPVPEPTPSVQIPTEITLLLVDSQAVTRAGLHRLLESYPGLHVIGEAADGVQAVSETLELGPHVVLMDTQLPEGQTLEALRQIKQLNLDTRVLLLSTQEREAYLYETLRAGADGYVLKDIAPAELVEAVRAVARGEVLVQPQLVSRLLSRFSRSAALYETLTVRELEVLRLLVRGLRNKEIAVRLFVSERTVNFHLANIYQKLNVSGRTEALSRAIELGLITA